jgi:hypothetical protein
LLWSSAGASWENLLRGPSIVLTFILFPLVVAAGIVWDEMESGRALLLHSLQVSRRSFIIGRAVGGLLYCAAGFVLPLSVMGFYFYLGARTSLQSALLVPFYALLYFSYMISILLFFSTFVRSWGNAAIVVCAQLFCGVALDALAGRLGGGETLLRFGRLIFQGPFRFILLAAQGMPPPFAEIICTVLFGFAFLGLAILFYRRSEIGAIAGRPAA